MSEPNQREEGGGRRRRLTRLAIQAAVSMVLIGILVYLARQGHVLASLASIPPTILAAAATLYVGACVLNSHRWQLLLWWLGIEQRLGNLTGLYFIGLFFSLFLPTGVGGDGVRIYQVARRSEKTAEAILATLQERLLGIGFIGGIGLLATFCFLNVLPPQVRLVSILMQLAALSGVVLLLQPRLVLRAVSRVAATLRRNDGLRRLSERPFVARVARAIGPIRDLPPMTARRLGRISLLTLVSIFLAIAAQTLLARGLQIDTGFRAFCLIVPLVWILRLLPVSLNGLGVSEGALVFLLGLFAVPADKALALGLALLGLQTGCALAGGVLLTVQIVRGGWKQADAPPGATVSPAAATDSDSPADGDVKHAA